MPTSGDLQQFPVVQGVQQFLANFCAFLQRQNLNEIWSVADLQ
jgi:hypothetical protein